MTPQSEVALPAVGELPAWDRWKWFIANAIEAYADNRNRPDLDGTSNLSAHLRWGEIHPRSLLADLAPLLNDRATEAGAERSQRTRVAGFYARCGTQPNGPLAVAGFTIRHRAGQRHRRRG